MTIIRHPHGVIIDGKAYWRDDANPPPITTHEWLAFAATLAVLGVWTLGLIWGAVWLIGQVVRRWL